MKRKKDHRQGKKLTLRSLKKKKKNILTIGVFTNHIAN